MVWNYFFEVTKLIIPLSRVGLRCGWSLESTSNGAWNGLNLWPLRGSSQPSDKRSETPNLESCYTFLAHSEYFRLLQTNN